jgi:hypothetical protein
LAERKETSAIVFMSIRQYKEWTFANNSGNFFEYLVVNFLNIWRFGNGNGDVLFYLDLYNLRELELKEIYIYNYFFVFYQVAGMKNLLFGGMWT